MQEIRCPDCGYRLKTNQCPICLKRVPFAGVQKQDAAEIQPRSLLPKKTRKKIHMSIDMGKKRRSAKTKKKSVSTAMIGAIIALVSLLSTAMESCDGSDSFVTEYDYDAYVAAGVGEAAHVPEIEEQYIYDDNGVLISVDGFGLYYGDYTIPMTVRNNTDHDIVIHSNELSVNDFMLPGAGLYCEVESGEEAQSFLILNDYDLEERGITEIAEVAFWLDIYEDEDYTHIGASDLIVLRSEIAGDVDQPVDDSGVEVYDNEDIRLVIKSVELTDYDYACVTVFAENRSDMIVTMADEGISLNGEDTYGMLWTTMRPQTQVIDTIYIDDLQELGIESEEQLEKLTIQLDIRFEENQTNPRQVLKTISETVEIDLTEVME